MEFIKRDIKIFILCGKASTGKSTVAKLIEDKINKKVITLAYASYLKMYAKEVLGWDGSEDTKPRDFLQTVGVELIKNRIDDKMLIRRIMEDIEVYSYFYDVIIISDARFPEEINMIKGKYNDVTVIHINSKKNNLTEKQKKHATETSLDDYNDYDFEIDNNSNIEVLSKKIDEVLEVSYGSSD